MPPESPETRRLAFDFQDGWICFPSPFYNHLERALAYTPTKHLSTSVQYCWTKLYQVLSQIGKMIDKITSDSRFTKEDTKPRPGVCLGNLFQAESDVIFLLKSCHNALARSACAVKLLDRSQQLWFAALTRSAERLVLLPVCPLYILVLVVAKRNYTEPLQVSSTIPCGLRSFRRATSSMSERYPHPMGFPLRDRTRQVRQFLSIQFSLANKYPRSQLDRLASFRQSRHARCVSPHTDARDDSDIDSSNPLAQTSSIVSTRRVLRCLSCISLRTFACIVLRLSFPLLPYSSSLSNLLSKLCKNPISPRTVLVESRKSRSKRERERCNQYDIAEILMRKYEARKTEERD